MNDRSTRETQRVKRRGSPLPRARDERPHCVDKKWKLWQDRGSIPTKCTRISKRTKKCGTVVKNDISCVQSMIYSNVKVLKSSDPQFQIKSEVATRFLFSGPLG
ncbi:predicted protein [Botrytis cinerea T4]|uniref:Uncharacterized protein n=1 Tax=Botryotinia fuckeliana (strain T4) TaxID=999810 RepID=G2YZG1_BOTF4|nr:predicted protein [Botrytis cinerea T4]